MSKRVSNKQHKTLKGKGDSRKTAARSEPKRSMHTEEYKALRKHRRLFK